MVNGLLAVLLLFNYKIPFFGMELLFKYTLPYSHVLIWRIKWINREVCYFQNCVLFHDSIDMTDPCELKEIAYFSLHCVCHCLICFTTWSSFLVNANNNAVWAISTVLWMTYVGDLKVVSRQRSTFTTAVIIAYKMFLLHFLTSIVC